MNMPRIIRAILLPPVILAGVLIMFWGVFQIPGEYLSYVAAFIAYVLCSLVVYQLWDD